MRKLLTFLERVRRWKISRCITIFIVICTLLSAGSYLFSAHGSASAKTSAQKGQVTANTSSHGDGLGGVSVSTANCQVTGPGTICAHNPNPGVVSSNDVNVGANQFNTTDGSYGSTPGWLTDSTKTGVNASAWLPAQNNGRPWVWFFQTYLDTTPSTGASSFTRDMWFLMLGVADMYIFILILMNGFRIMGGAIGFRYQEVVETLPQSILIIIVAHISLLFVAFCIALSNNMTQFLYVTISTYARAHNMVPGYPDVSNLQGTYGAPDVPLPVVGSLVDAWRMLDIFTHMDQALPKFVAWGILQVIMVQVICRLIGLQLVTIFGGPLVMLGASPFKQGKEAMRGWFLTVFTTAFAQTVQVTSLLIGGIVACSIYNMMHVNSLLATSNDATQAVVTQHIGRNGLVGNMTTYVTPVGTNAVVLWVFVAVLWFTFKSAGLVRSSIANIGTEAVQSMSGSATGLAWGASIGRFAYDQGWSQFGWGQT